MSDLITRLEFDKALAQVQKDIHDLETRLRREWTDQVRHEVRKLDDHLGEQDTKLAWLLGIFVTGLVSLIVWLSDYVITHH